MPPFSKITKNRRSHKPTNQKQILQNAQTHFRKPLTRLAHALSPFGPLAGRTPFCRAPGLRHSVPLAFCDHKAAAAAARRRRERLVAAGVSPRLSWARAEGSSHEQARRAGDSAFFQINPKSAPIHHTQQNNTEKKTQKRPKEKEVSRP